MNRLYRGSTASVRVKFCKVPISSISKAVLTLKQSNLILEYYLESAVFEESSLLWKLPQEDTLKILENENIEIQIRWKLADGTIGNGPEYTVSAGRILHDEVI